MWLKLLAKDKNIGELLKPTFVNGKWRKPDINGRHKKQLQVYFEKAGVPWIYTQQRPEIHTTSAYNRKPKGNKVYNSYEARISMIRKNLSV